MIALLPLLLAATPVASEAPAVRQQASRVATATVTIISAERIEVRPTSTASARTDRQYRNRGSVPMVEFF
jgi:hypothetical protein